MQGLRGKLITLEGVRVPSWQEWPGPGSWGLLRTAGAQAVAVSLHPSLDRCPQGQGARPGPALSGHRRSTKFQEGQITSRMIIQVRGDGRV